MTSPDRFDEETQAELSGIAAAVERRFDPGATALTVSIAMLGLLVSLILPWTGTIAGWTILVGGAPQLGVLPRLFVLLALIAGLCVPAAALATRWWPLAWLAAVGCGISVVTGIWAAWSRQVGVPEGGTPAHVGLVLALVAVVVLAANWARIALRR